MLYLATQETERSRDHQSNEDNGLVHTSTFLSQLKHIIQMLLIHFICLACSALVAQSHAALPLRM